MRSDNWNLFHNVEECDEFSFDILCGAPILAFSIVTQLHDWGFHLDRSSPIKLIIDDPQGFALHEMENLDTSDMRVIVRTLNPCVEYWKDLWDLGPYVLLVGASKVEELANALTRSCQGQRYRNTPNKATSLTRSERRVLYHLAHGLTNKQVARRLTLQGKDGYKHGY